MASCHSSGRGQLGEEEEEIELKAQESMVENRATG